MDSDSGDAFRQDRLELATGLLAHPARIDPRFFYDDRGSALFERITRLPEYYLTRTELGLLERQADAIARAIGPIATLIEPGAGNCEKAELLCTLLHPGRFIGLDVSSDFLAAAAQRLRRRFPTMEVRSIAANLRLALPIPADIPEAGRLLFYPGSSIGNFEPAAARALLRRLRATAGAHGRLLIGIDLVKDAAVLDAAYNDSAGVTAAFNRNVLDHLNRVLGSNFEPARWRHRAFFNPAPARIEMHLETDAPQRVRWPGGQRDFAAGERIHTENSYKYRLTDFHELLRTAGFAPAATWSDARAWYALILAEAR